MYKNTILYLIDKFASQQTMLEALQHFTPPVYGHFLL